MGRKMERIKRSLVVRVIQTYGSTHAGSYSAAVALNAFVSMFPIMLGVLAIIGLALGSHAIESKAESTIVTAFPVSAQASVRDALSHLNGAAGVFGILSIAGLLFAGSNLFASLEFAMAQIFGIKQRNFLRQRAMGVLMIVVLGVGLVVDVGLNTLMNVVPFMAGLGPLLALIDMVALMLLIYRLVPDRTFHVSQVWPGALIAGILTEAITLLFPLYAKLVHGFNSYGQEFALFFLLVAWLSFIAQFILIGAVWNKARLGAGYDAIGLVATPTDSSSQVPISAGQRRPAEPAATARRAAGGSTAPGDDPGTPGGGPATARDDPGTPGGGSATPRDDPIADAPARAGGGNIRPQ